MFILNQWICSLILLCIISIWFEMILLTNLRTAERILSPDKMRFLFQVKGDYHITIQPKISKELFNQITEEQA